MSLFENDSYCWRETYFVLFRESRRPSVDTMRAALQSLGSFEIKNVSGDAEGRFESATVVAPADYAAMDITFVGGEDVAEQTEQLLRDLDLSGLQDEEQEKAERLKDVDARIDIYHFEKVAGSDEDEGNLDPMSLLMVMQVLVSLCEGVGVDPQSGSLV
jgi:hypothetical protein